MVRFKVRDLAKLDYFTCIRIIKNVNCRILLWWHLRTLFCDLTARRRSKWCERAKCYNERWQWSKSCSSPRTSRSLYCEHSCVMSSSASKRICNVMQCMIICIAYTIQSGVNALQKLTFYLLTYLLLSVVSVIFSRLYKPWNQRYKKCH